ncbi:MAG TPA: hypothetical protein VMB19_00300 [Silvibacterium sp.]|nr:hypothetical protein [Silvibacterium sp.]
MPSHTFTRASTPGHCLFHEAHRVVEQHFAVAHMHTEWRESDQIGIVET